MQYRQPENTAVFRGWPALKCVWRHNITTSNHISGGQTDGLCFHTHSRQYTVIYSNNLWITASSNIPGTLFAKKKLKCAAYILAFHSKQ